MKTTDYYAHPSAIIDTGAKIGKGTKIWHFCHIGPEAVIGKICSLGQNVYANATIICGVTLGEYCFIGAGAVVTGDVPPYALMTGVPARQTGWVDKTGRKSPEIPKDL